MININKHSQFNFLLSIVLSFCFFTACMTGQDEASQEELDAIEDMDLELESELEEEEEASLDLEEDEADLELEEGEADLEESPEENKGMDQKQVETPSPLKEDSLIADSKTADSNAEAVEAQELLSEKQDVESSSPPMKVQKEKDYFIYKIIEGDWLSKISEKVYGDPHVWSRIYDFNRKELKHPDKILAGASLRVPIVDEQSKSFADSYQASLDSVKNTDMLVIKVKAGDSLSSPAQSHLEEASLWQTIGGLNKEKTKNPARILFKLAFN